MQASRASRLVDHCPGSERLGNLSPNTNCIMGVAACKHQAKRLVFVWQRVSAWWVHMADFEE
jgi:hypothetical protein